MRNMSLGASSDQLKAVYVARIRSILEFAAPVFSSGLTKDQSSQIEMIQKKSLAIILGSRYLSYEHAMSLLDLERLDKRREDLCYKFALSCTQSQKHKHMFPKTIREGPLTRKNRPYVEYQCTTSRYFNSAIPYMARLLNQKCVSQ